MSPLRKMGLLEEDGALAARGQKWRVDSTFGEACQEILDEIYPKELASLTGPNGAPDPEKVKTWFDHKGFGDSNAQQMASTYVLVANKQIPETVPTEPKKADKKPSKANPQKQTTAVAGEKQGSTSSSPSGSPNPSLHLDIQIHIPADASAEQIDQIFASMAKHLYPK